MSSAQGLQSPLETEVGGLRSGSAYQTATAASSISRTLRLRALGVNGFVMKVVPSSRKTSNQQVYFEPIQNFTNRICYAVAFDSLWPVDGRNNFGNCLGVG